ncbi:DNA helicase [Trifolium repens]|nr:DNA helicase [Trifolium repens]
MSTYSKYLEVTPLASFTAIYLSNQIYGEVDPYFVKEYAAQLQGTWKFIDYKDTLHTVEFNQSFIHPLLTTGWREMKDIPMYHSRFIRLGYTIEFYQDLTSDNITKPFLPIFGIFEEYLRACNFRYIMACCDNGTIDTFDIAMTDKPFKTTSIGLGWNEFCTTSEFVVGDVLCFKFSMFDCSNVGFVYKINL